MLNLQWNAVALYPAGHYVRQIKVDARRQTPRRAGKPPPALEVASQDGATIPLQNRHLRHFD